MPSLYSAPDDARDWPVKVYRGTFSQSKRWDLEARCWRRRVRAEFRPPT